VKTETSYGQSLLLKRLKKLESEIATDLEELEAMLG